MKIEREVESALKSDDEIEANILLMRDLGFNSRRQISLPWQAMCRAGDSLASAA